MAHHGRRAGVPGHAALAPLKARRTLWRARTRADLEPRRGIDPEHEALLTDSVGLALLVVLETLSPAERVAFMLHDMFAVAFEAFVPIVGRSPSAAKQRASRAYRRVQGATNIPYADLAR
jgi:RNA polymerase sigma-70 factor, ECF subfamily